MQLTSFLAWSSALVLASAQQQPVVPRQKLSSDGLEVSRIALGGLHIPELKEPEKVVDILHTALDVGITTLDLADIYGYNKSAELIGQAFALEPGLREKFQIVYKTDIVFPGDVQYIDTSAAYLERSLGIALTQLNTTYIDLFMLHAPDILLNAKEVADTFQKFKASERVKYFGVSNFPVSMFKLLNDALEEKDIKLTTEELEASILTPTPFIDGRIDYLYKEGISALAWGPLGGDPLAGANRLFKLTGEKQTRIRAALQAVAAEIGPDIGEDQVALAWLLRHPSNVVPIIGSVNADRIRKQAESVNIELTRLQWSYILGASAVAEYKRWEQLHSGEWHDVINDYKNAYGTPLGVNVPQGFCDFDSCKAAK